MKIYSVPDAKGMKGVQVMSIGTAIYIKQSNHRKGKTLKINPEMPEQAGYKRDNKQM